MTTRVYRYGLLPPTASADVLEQQMVLEHRYHIDLIMLERERRARIRQIQGAGEEVARLAEEISQAAARLEAAVKATKQEHQKTTSRSETAAERRAIQEARAQLRDLRARYRAARRAYRADPAVQAALTTVTTEIQTRARAARAECGLYWGNYLRVEQAVDAASRSKTEPHFPRWSGSGEVAVQCQHGLSVTGLLAATDRRVQLDTTPQPVPGRGGRPRVRGKPLPRLRLRVGSVGRDPVWAEWPIVLHRPLPPEAMVMWVVVRRDRFVGHDRWYAIFTLALPDDWRVEPSGKGLVAVDLGWRKRGDALRVAYWRGDDHAHGELLLEPEISGGLAKTEDLRSIRDRLLDELRPRLAAWLAAQTLPEWLAGEAGTLAQWRSQRRFARLARVWRDARWDGDTAGYTLLEAWRTRDKHLWLWESCQRDKSLGRRLDQYRRFAADLARSYGVLVLEDFDLRALARHQPPEAETPEIAPARHQRQLAGVSLLRHALRDAMTARGGSVVTVSAADTTRACHACGHIDAWDQAADLVHECSGCHARWDQDDNACRNLLTRAREQAGADGEAGAARVNSGAEIAGGGSSRGGKWARRKATARAAHANIAPD